MPLPPALLHQLDLLRELPPAQQERLAGLMSERSYARREIVFNKEEPGQFLCFLLEGRLQGVDFTLDGREVGLYFVEPGQYFGEMSVIDGLPRGDYVIAVARARVALLPAEEARRLMTQTAEIASVVLRRLTGQLRAATAQRALLGLPNPAQRVCAQLLQLLPGGTGAHQIAHAPTHQELAIMINSSRETVTRVFQVLQARGTVAREGHGLEVLDLASLTAIAEGREELPRGG